MSITEPSKAEISLILLVSRLTSRSRYPRFIEGIGLEGNEKVLDFGAGWGENTRLIAKKLDKGGRVTALDVSPQWQEVARKRLREYDNIDFINSDIRSAGLKDGCFDVIVIDYVLHDIPRNSRMAIVLELGKKVKVGGLVQLREPTKERHGMPPEEIRSLMTSAGLKESSTLVKKNVFQAMYVKGQGVISYGER